MITIKLIDLNIREKIIDFLCYSGFSFNTPIMDESIIRVKNECSGLKSYLLKKYNNLLIIIS